MLEGRLNEFRLGDVFQLLAWTGKSGALTVEAGQRRGRVDFSGGQVAFAIADVRRAELGARLANAGVVDEDGLRRVVEAQQSGPGRVAEALLEEGLDEHVIEETLREHIQDAVFTLLRTADGGFTFEPGDGVADGPGPRLEIEALVAEGARRLEEWEEVRRRIPSPDAVLAMTPSPPADSDSVTVSADQWRLLVLVDGARSVAELVELTAQGEFATSQVLAELVEAGLLDAVDPADGDTGLGQLLARRQSLRELEESELGIPSEVPRPEPDTAGPEPEANAELTLVPGPEAAAGFTFEAEPEDVAVPMFEGELEAPADLESETALDETIVDEAVLDEAVLDEAVLGEAVLDEAVLDEAVLDESALDAQLVGVPDDDLSGSLVPSDSGPAPWGADPAPEEEPTRDEDALPPADEPQAPREEPIGSDADTATRPGVDRVQVARELASLGFEGPPATPAPTTDESPRRLTRDEDVTRGLLVRLMDGVRKA